MTAAIYARKSTAQADTPEEARSVTRQVEGARAFITARGWTLAEAHVYTDDGVSGALFANRAEFSRMMRDAEAGAFGAVIFYDLDRFGRNARRSMDALYKLADLGVEVWDYSTALVVDLDSFEGETLTFLKARFAQQYRDQVRKHTKSAMRKKAEQGLVTGGRTFGYDNLRLAKGQTGRVPNEAEAAVVRDIFARFAAGQGIRSIAAALNHAGACSPRAQQGRPCGWSASTVRAVLERPLYRGEVIYGRSAKAYGRELGKRSAREKGQLPTSEETWLRRAAPELRLIDPDLAERVDARRLDRRTRYLASLERPDGRMPEKASGRYLLSGGLLVCPACGAHFEARKYPWKGHPGDVYMCSTRRRKPGCCANPLMLPIAETDDAVLSVIEGEVVHPRIIEELLSLVDRGEGDDGARLTADRNRLRAEVDRLVDSIAAGVPADTIAPKVREREVEIAKIDARLHAPRPECPDIDKLRAALTLRVADWRRDLRTEPKVARLLLRQLIGPLTLCDEPRPEWVRWEAPARAERLLDGVWSNWVASPTGLNPYNLTARLAA